MSVLDRLRAKGLLDDTDEAAPVRKIRSSSHSHPEPMAALTVALAEDFAAHGTVTEIRVSGIRETLFMVPTAEAAQRLMAWEGVSRGRIWTARELADMATVPARRTETWKAVILAKLLLDADLVETRAR